MNRQQKIELLALLQERERRKKYRKINEYFPDDGPLRRELYQKHLEFFKAGVNHEERLALAANRIGKTESMGGYELVLHLTGQYPDWWEGRRFDRPIEAWAAGKSGQTVRDIIQKKLLGPIHDKGSGLIKQELIEKTTPRSGIPNAVDTIFVKHTSGGTSELSFKSYDQGRQSFEGTKKDVIWLDEECPLDVYTECLLRTTDTSGKNEGNGIMMLTFTPLMGMSELVLEFLPNGEVKEISDGPKCVITATWDDVPHLTEETKKKLLASIPPFQRDARSKGVPQLGAGAIYPVSEDDWVVDPFEMPKHWKRVYGLDVGWNRTAAIWAAIDPETSVIYEYSEHYQGNEKPVVHAQSIKARGEWIPGVIDPASRGRSQVDGQQLFNQYRELGLKIIKADNAVEAGIYAVWELLSAGKLKTFKTCKNIIEERRMYRRDEKGKIVKQKDHLMDAERYLIMSGRNIAKTEPVPKPKTQNYHAPSSGGWMG
ncbi:MAG: putative terminase large subunit [Prokaryotic dsDNA virus sp.]|nr:MAG: putative terminase large subunit [Prokaryotic dsDNA virus sp.]|tara:strand:- start:23173 stop:24624 length:1452 start_codon:yes stop_codon:yes gene_type:complete